MRCAKSLAALLCGVVMVQFAACAAPTAMPEAPDAARTAYALTTEYAAEPIGVDEPQPRFAWQLPQAGSDGRQSAYRLRVATSIEALTRAPLWDSGRIVSDALSQIAYGGPALQSRTRYVWQVQTTDGRGRVSDWSAPASFETGLLAPADWSAQWISGRTTVDHDWKDARITIDFTLTGKSLGVLFRARPVGKTYGEAYLWRLNANGGAPQLGAQLRRYPGGSSSNVAVSNLRTLPIAMKGKQSGAEWLKQRHRLVIDTRGATIVTTLDGAKIDTLTDDTQASGTIGFISNEANAAIIHAVKVEAGDTSFATDFADGVNPFTGGAIVDGGLRVAAGVPDKDLVLPLSAPAPLLRRAFDVGEKPVSARLYVAAGGFADVALNGMRIGDALQDGYTAYDRRVQYRSFDVTPSIKAGGNVLGVELGRGWYGVTEPNEWYWHMAPWHAAPALKLQLELRYADGRSERIVSDADWRTTDGPTRHDSIYGGERYDARLAPRGWRDSGFDDAKWNAATIVSGPAGRLVAAAQEPIAKVADIAPVALKEAQPGIWVYDFGRIFAGRLHLNVSGPRGTTVRMIQTEKLQDDGTVAIVSGLVDAQLQTDQYTLAGDGDEQWTPRFSYKGFRYVQVEGFPGTPTLAALHGEVVHSAVAMRGAFESSDALLNSIQSAARNTILNNMHGNQTDTPTLEKNGWTGDAQASALASALNFGTARVWSKWLADFRDAQSPQGEIPEIVPSTPYYGYENTPGWNMVWGPLPSWDAATFVLPDELYEQLGDRRIIEKMYDTQKRLVDYTGTFFSKDLKYANPNNPFLGEYASPMPAGGLMEAIRTMPSGPVDMTASAYYYFMIDKLAHSAALLGKADDATQYRALAARVREAYNTRYWDAGKQLYRSLDGSGKPRVYAQTPNVLAVAFGLVPDGLAAAAMRSVSDDIVARQFHLGTGVYAGRYVMTLLCDYGYADTAYRVATQRDYPSWGYWIDNGLSTMAEGWELSARSWDHHYWGSISSYFYQGLAGIRAGAPGYRHVVIRPAPPSGLASARASIDAPQGTIESAWRRAGGTLVYDIAIPNGSDAEIRLPLAGAKPPRAPAGARLLRAESGAAVYSAGPGRYHFEIADRAP
jgi:alpha-L-rhamnosidase